MANYKEDRPWGSFEVLFDGPEFKVKTLTVLPGKRLSYQSHEKRSENWVVAKGIALVELDDEFIQLKTGEHVFIPVRTKHRLENRTDKELVIVETQTGTYFGEDDIVRYEDDFKRLVK